MERLFVKIQIFYVTIPRFFFLILLKYDQNNEIRTTTVTTTIIVVKNIEKKNEMIRKMSVKIKMLCNIMQLFKSLRRVSTYFRYLSN